MLKLYFAPGASSMATHIALHEIGVEFERVPVSLANRQQREEQLLHLNPEAKVPTLLIDGRVLSEVAANLYYLARRYPDAGLWPAQDIEAEAQIISWMSFTASTLHGSRAKGADHVLKVFDIANRRLGSNDWAVGQYSVADIHLFRLYWRIKNWLDLPPTKFPALQSHHDRMMSRPAVQETLRIESEVGYELSN